MARLALAGLSACAELTSYAVPDVLPAGHMEFGVAAPFAYSVSNRRQLAPAPRPLRDDERVATLTPGAAFVRVGVLDVVELGAQLGSSIWPRVKGQLLRGARPTWRSARADPRGPAASAARPRTRS